MNKKIDNSALNSLYIQLQKDLRTKKNIDRVYVPVALFKNPEDIQLRKYRPSIKRGIISALGAIIK